jgi:hypothetical protein
MTGDDLRRPPGVIAEITSRFMANALHRLGMPVVDIAGHYPASESTYPFSPGDPGSRESVFSRTLRTN